jgi:hypothetical protein
VSIHNGKSADVPSEAAPMKARWILVSTHIEQRRWPTGSPFVLLGIALIASSALAKAQAALNTVNDKTFAVSAANGSALTASCPAPASNAFTGCYYKDQNLMTVGLSRTDAYPINFNWRYGSPDPAVPADHFSARWSGNFTFNAGSYKFLMNSDDGSRLYIDGVTVIDKWFDQAGAVTYTYTQNMTAGTHLITMEYYENTAGALAKLSWVQNATSDLIPPAIPAGLTAAIASPTQIDLFWPASTDNVGVAGYYVYRNGARIATSTATSFSDAGLDPLTSFAYAVSAFDAAGNVSTSSSVVWATTPSPLLPINPDITFVTLPDTQAMVQSYPLVWNSECQWILDNRYARNIQVVLSMGDITNTGTTIEWQRAAACFNELKAAGIIALPLIGNHDYDGALDPQLYNAVDPAPRLATKYDSYWVRLLWNDG